ncbi:pyrroline-5-carboxylate reductase [Aneurinibacillus terranovensis]|uniref:pyrroline-5-carboxylate reductase n=1 Tax=Aneurinibacillus terranovensis TaxID=278991 RepID=UPI0003F6EEF6|nr:pyrroline-5-carboxylate reductase [Aneurinibacillus terranovensis]
MVNRKTVAFLGAGAIAEAMIAGMIATKKFIPQQIIAANRENRERRKKLTDKYGIRTMPIHTLDMKEADILILAMKPKDAEAVFASIRDNVSPAQLILSVLGGISTAYIEKRLENALPVVRAMPNTSSMIGESATAVVFGSHVKPEQQKIALELLQSIGQVSVIEEHTMDIFTAIAGSGPAYFYYLVEHMVKAGRESGLDPQVARNIAAQTMLGAGKMLLQTVEPPEVLRRNVTTPKGITAAGLDALEQNGGGVAIEAAIKRAAARSKEMSEQ